MHGPAFLFCARAAEWELLTFPPPDHKSGHQQGNSGCKDVGNVSEQEEEAVGAQPALISPPQIFSKLLQLR